ncbi:MAG: SPOR domain-containing protein [Desulfobacteraceae bacterium]|nr:SPOR domain-containing protein [Desulfobacteraceae bacterium]
MMRMLRHTTLCLWMVSILGIPLVFWAMPLVNGIFPGHDLLIALVLFSALYIIVGAAMNRMGEGLVIARVKEAETWERAGIVRRSEQRFLKALRLYDTALISPFRARRVALVLAGALARFSLTSTLENPAFDRAVKAFLRMAPQEEEIALLWLKRLCNGTTPGREDHEILTLVAEEHLDHPVIRELVAELFVASGRTDFVARKVYKMVRSGVGVSPETLSDINELLGPETLARPAFPATGFKRSSGVNLSNLAGGLGRGARGIGRMVKNAVLGLPMVVNGTAALLKRGYTFFRERKTLQTALKRGLGVVVAVVILGFMVNTVAHLFQSAPKTPEVKKVEVAIPKQFTIQVAAYLKKKHADAYVAKLKGKGLDAYVYKADGGGRTWFIVRISRFADKKSAADYGNGLKRQHLIDDFFVDNN